MSITKVDANGRVLLPIGIRYRLDLDEGDELAIDYLDDGTIILKKIVRSITLNGKGSALQQSDIDNMQISTHIAQIRAADIRSSEETNPLSFHS